MGGKTSEEILVKSNFSDDGWLEVAHIFDLDNFYSQKFNVLSANKENIYMSSYGIGISRLLMILLEKQKDNYGFYGTNNFNSFEYNIICANHKDDELKKVSDELYNKLKNKNISVLIDDRNCSFGKKISDSDLILCNNQIIIGQKYRKNNCLEIINRKTKEFKICNLNDFINFELDKKSFF